MEGKRNPFLEEDTEASYLLIVCFEDGGNLSNFIGSKEGASREKIADTGNGE